jgi:hypothetical protein
VNDRLFCITIGLQKCLHARKNCRSSRNLKRLPVESVTLRINGNQRRFGPLGLCVSAHLTSAPSLVGITLSSPGPRAARPLGSGGATCYRLHFAFMSCNDVFDEYDRNIPFSKRTLYEACPFLPEYRLYSHETSISLTYRTRSL